MNYLFILLISLFSCNTETAERFSEEALNDAFETLEGETLQFKDILKAHKGKTILIDVWASWCGDCLRGMPKVKELQEKHKDVSYVFLSLDRGQEAWKRGIAKYDVRGDHYYMLSGRKGPFASFTNLDWIPRYMVIDPKGKIKVFRAVEADDNAILKALK